VRKTIGLALAFVLVSAALPAHDVAADVDAAKRAIKLADLELAKAVADRSLQDFISLVDQDAIFFGRDISRGKDSVSKAWLPFFTDRNLFLKWHPNEVYVSSSADLGYSIGEYGRIGKDKSGNPETATGTYVSIWRKQPDGHWKIVLDIGTPGTPKPKTQ
jgi:ketosteroid isomerase-like protein